MKTRPSIGGEGGPSKISNGGSAATVTISHGKGERFMNDIGKELYERVRADFERRLAAEKHPPKDMRGVSDYSARVGRYLAEAIAANVTEDALPDRRLYYNIAESILEPSLRTNYELVNDTAAEVQRLLDEKQGLRIKPARADYPEERVHAVIGAASEEGIEFDRALRRMTSPAENITQSFADDFMQANAEQRSRAGFDTFIERQGGLNCCPWCAGLVGVFAYPKGLPKEVFARHDNCTCSVTYGTKGGARQHVWSKQTWSSAQEREYLRLRDEEKKKAGGKRLTEKQVAAIIAKVGSQPRKLTYKEALVRGGFAQPRRLTGGANGGIIRYNDNGEAMYPPTSNVSKLDYFLNDRLNQVVTNVAQSIMDELKKHVLGTELADIISLSPPFSRHGIILGDEGAMTVSIPLCGETSIIIHNHPSGNTFSSEDIDRFVINQKAKYMCVIGNNGKWYVLEKGENFDYLDFYEKAKEAIKQDKLAETVLKEVDRYGFNKYYQS